MRRVQGGIEIEIPGAKVTETKGQPRRKILIDAKSPAGLHLGMALGAKAEIEMSRGQRIGPRLRRHPAKNGPRYCQRLLVQASGQFGPEGSRR